MRKVRKFSTITFRVPTDAKEKLEEMADSEFQTVSDICRRSILQTLREWESGISNDPFGEKSSRHCVNNTLYCINNGGNNTTAIPQMPNGSAI